MGRVTETPTALVPCGGSGSGLLPFTRVVDKSLLPLLGRPVIDWVLETLARTGIERVAILLPAHGRSLLPRYYEGYRPYGLELTFSRQKVGYEDFGTGILEAWQQVIGRGWYIAASPDAPLIVDGAPGDLGRLRSLVDSGVTAAFLAVEADDGAGVAPETVPQIHLDATRAVLPRYHWLMSEEFIESFRSARQSRPKLPLWRFASEGASRGLPIEPVLLESGETCTDLGEWDRYHRVLTSLCATNPLHTCLPI